MNDFVVLLTLIFGVISHITHTGMHFRGEPFGGECSGLQSIPEMGEWCTEVAWHTREDLGSQYLLSFLGALDRRRQQGGKAFTIGSWEAPPRVKAEDLREKSKETQSSLCTARIMRNAKYLASDVVELKALKQRAVKGERKFWGRGHDRPLVGAARRDRLIHRYPRLRKKSFLSFLEPELLLLLDTVCPPALSRSPTAWLHLLCLLQIAS